MQDFTLLSNGCLISIIRTICLTGCIFLIVVMPCLRNSKSKGLKSQKVLAKGAKANAAFNVQKIKISPVFLGLRPCFWHLDRFKSGLVLKRFA